MEVLSFSKRCKLTALAVALSLGLSACTSTTNDASKDAALTINDAFATLNKSEAEYEKLANSADASSRFSALVLLTRSAIVSRNFEKAAGLISTLQQEAITPLERDEAQIIEGLLFMHQNRNTDALFSLNRVAVASLPPAVASFYYQLISNVEYKLYQESHRVDHLIKSCQNKVALLNFVNPDAKFKVAMQITKQLQVLSPSDLTVILNQSTDNTLKGFYDFALIDTSNSARIKQQLAQDWLKKYEDHPLKMAAEQLAAGRGTQAAEETTNIDGSAIIPLKEGDKLAVLLPLTGRFANSVGEPARLGILAALQDRNSKLQVTFYDTNRMAMPEIASALKQSNTNFIIGPILKPEVDALLATDLKLPAIVFNTPANARENLFYFNLGPDYEGSLAASKMFYDGLSSPVVIAPESTRGLRAVTGFNETWQETQHRPAVVCRYTDINNINASLTTCPVNNADGIYINATANEVIKIRPSLPDNTPLYLTDRSYMGLNHSSGEVALAGANLGDMPWLLTDSALKMDLLASLPKADTQVQRIFATAYDSLNFAFNLRTLSQDKSDVLHGISGDLQIGKKGLIEMAPMWVKLDVNRPVY